VVAGLLIAQIVVTVFLASIFLVRPSVTASTVWKIVAFAGLCVLPALCVVGGMDFHMQRSEQTQFCISCHVMQPYGRSLYVDDPNYIPAQHFQNHRVPADRACYSCHADYSIYGPLNEKITGLTRIWKQYVTSPPNTITIPGGFKNEQCLHCHAGSRKFEEDPTHTALMDTLKSNQLSCLTGGCHDTVHNINSLDHVKFWSPGQ
jgi:cytochrome c-type protein NapC